MLLGAAAVQAEPGASIYLRGLLSSGEPVRALRDQNAPLEGAKAACVNCHRRSGLGSIEGIITIPPIAGPYLFTRHGESLEKLGVPFVDAERVNHEAYTEETLARALRDGTGANGKPLNYLMPRYELDDAAMSDLIAYLKALKVKPAPGVTQQELHFATIITPDADPVKRHGMLAVMQQYFVDKNNAAARTKAPTLFSSHVTMFRVERRWQLHVWELTGAPAGWDEQLRRHLATEPVFAVISGLAGNNWTPVQRFCEEQGLPCLFPNVEAPTRNDSDFYTVYFSRGVLLEAQLIARDVQEQTERPRRIVQIYRIGDVGAAAAEALQKQPTPSALPVVSHALKANASTSELAAALTAVGSTDALVLWLRPADLAALKNTPPPTLRVWVSGEMGELELAPLPPAWRSAVHMAYPVDLPNLRVARVDYAMGWFRLRKIAVVAPRVQADTYLACGLVSETLNHITDAFVRDYLIERVEMAIDHRALTGYYPRLTLAPGQRFASKGGYIVRFTDEHGPRIAPLGEWTTP
jgi:cytochrome c553